MNAHNHKNNYILQDVGIIFLSILVAIILVQTETLSKILTATKELKLIGSFVAGMFFTSVFTITPAAAALGEIARANSILLTAFFGSIGAVIGDLIIFRFFKDKLSEHLMELVEHQKGWKRIKALFRLRSFRWLTALAGGLVIASPLPDELGICLLGCSKIKTSRFIPLSFIFNFLGILLIGWIAQAI